MLYTTLLFDLDGTLLDTLPDLACSVNHALAAHGLPPRSRREVRAFLGHGIRQLMLQAVPAGTDEARFEAAFATFRAHYMAHCTDRTAPYPGIMPLLAALRQLRVRTAIVSNKLDPAVQELRRRFFADCIPLAIGESAAVRRKPCPDSLLEAMRRLGSVPEQTLYVGDSEVDIEAARRAGVSCATVLWGFRDEAFLRRAGATLCVARPLDLLSLLSDEEGAPSVSV